MAVGDGGFSTKPMGFDKNEVNEYISNLRKRMQEIEAEKKVNDEKTRAAVKTAEEAEEKIKAAEQAGEKKAAEFEMLLKKERKTNDDLAIKIDDLKRKLKQAQAGGGAASGAASSAAADKQAAQIIESANATAQEIVEKAKKTAQEIISGANGASASSNANTEEFMSVLKNFMDTVSSGFKTVNDKASELLGAAPAAVEMPDFSAYTAPKAEVPKAKPAPAPAPAKKEEPVELDPSFQFSDMGDSADEEMDMNGFGGDIQPLDPPGPKHEVVEGFDLSGINNIAEDGDVSEIEPLDENGESAEMTDDFTVNLLAQTATGGALSGLDDDILAAVEKENAQHAVQPNDDVPSFDMEMGMGLDMDMGDPGSDSGSSSDSGINAMNDLLASMGAALESAGGSADDTASMEPDEPDNGGANPWADLQAQLNAMEQSGGLSDDSSDDLSAASSVSEDRKVPDADDSAVWNFGGDSDDSGMESSDDDMSSDLFGSF